MRATWSTPIHRMDYRHTFFISCQLQLTISFWLRYSNLPARLLANLHRVHATVPARGKQAGFHPIWCRSEVSHKSFTARRWFVFWFHVAALFAGRSQDGPMNLTDSWNVLKHSVPHPAKALTPLQRVKACAPTEHGCWCTKSKFECPISYVGAYESFQLPNNISEWWGEHVSPHVETSCLSWSFTSTECRTLSRLFCCRSICAAPRPWEMYFHWGLIAEPRLHLSAFLTDVFWPTSNTSLLLRFPPSCIASLSTAQAISPKV